MASILFISPFYPPEKAAAAVCVSENATRLAKRGHDVTVLTTFPNHPTGVVPPEFRGRIFQEEMRDGVRVVRIWSYISPHKSFFHRVLGQLSFAALAPLLGGKAVGKPDLLIVHSPPLFDALAGRLLAWYKRCPFIFFVADVWPAAAIELGVLRNRWLIRLSNWLEWSTYQHARLVWVVTEGVRDLLLQRGVPAERLLLIPNGVDTTQFRPLPQAHCRAQLQWDERFCVLYIGNHGLAYQLETVLEAAKRLQDDASYHFIFIGDGVMKSSLLDLAHTLDLHNVTFLDAIAHEHVPTAVAAANICLIPCRKVSLLGTTLPLKMLEFMACAKPFILGIDGIARRIAEQEAQAGLVVEPGNVTELVAAISYLRKHPQAALSLGAQGRAYVEAHFDYEQLVTRLERAIMPLLLDESRCPSPDTHRALMKPVEKSQL